MKRSKLLRTAILVVTMLAMILSLAACGGGPAAPAAPAATTAAPAAPAATTAAPAAPATTAPAAPAAPAKVFELKFSLHDPATSVNAIYMQKWADMLLAKTNGGIKVTLYPSQAIAKAADVGEMVETGGADIGWLFTTFYPGQFPLTDVTAVPLIGFGDPVSSTEALWDLYAKYPEVKAEWDTNYKTLMLYTNPGMLFAGNKPITKPDDLKGMILRSPAGPITDLVTALGASPVVMAPPDIYESLSKNNIQGYVFEQSGMKSFKLGEVTKYMTDMPMYNGAFGWVMNKDVWNSLPEDYKKIIEESTGKKGSLELAQVFKDDVAVGMKHLTDNGCQIVTLTAEQKAEFQKVADQVAAKWPEKIKLSGFDAKAYIEDAKATVAKYNK